MRQAPSAQIGRTPFIEQTTFSLIIPLRPSPSRTKHRACLAASSISGSPIFQIKRVLSVSQNHRLNLSSTLHSPIQSAIPHPLTQNLNGQLLRPLSDFLIIGCINDRLSSREYCASVAFLPFCPYLSSTSLLSLHFLFERLVSSAHHDHLMRYYKSRNNRIRTHWTSSHALHTIRSMCSRVATQADPSNNTTFGKLPVDCTQSIPHGK